MTSEHDDTHESDAAQERIGELEARVRDLSGTVERLLAEKADGQVAEAPKAGFGRSSSTQALVAGVREGVGRALGGEAGESLESRIGGIWLSRVASLLVMTALVLGGAMTIQEEDLLPLHKLFIGYAIAAVAMAYGFLSRNNRDLFPQTMLGSGLALVYFTTYAGFFIETTAVFSGLAPALPVLFVCLVLVGAVIHFRRSQTVAGIALFLIYYTVVLSLSEGGGGQNVYYALAICLSVSALALVFNLTHRWLLFTWASLIATQLTYIYFFVVNQPQLDLSGRAYFWVSNGFLTATYILFSLACITDARKTGEFRKTVAPMAGVNSFVYFALSWVAIRQYYLEDEWKFRLFFAVMLAVFAVYAELAGPRRNYLFQIFIAKTVVMFTLALQARLSPEWLLTAMALECLGLGFSYKRSALVMFKLLGLGLLAITLVGCLFSVRFPGEVVIAGYAIPAKWFTCTAVPVVFAVVSWFYAHFVRPVPPEAREAKGQWFLADTVLDVRGPAVALLYAVAGALILVAITIIDLGSDPALPYLLAGESVLMALVGLLLFTPQVQVASVLLLLSAHVCYHVSFLMEKPGFDTQANFVLYTIAVAGVTYLGGLVWERYVRGIHGTRKWEANAVATIPYVAATLMLISLMALKLDALYAPLAQNLLGVGLLLLASFAPLFGLRVSGILALAIGTMFFYRSLYHVEDPIAGRAQFPLALCLTAACYICSERIIAWSRPGRFGGAREAGIVRSALVAVAILLTGLGLWEWAAEAFKLDVLYAALAQNLLGVGLLLLATFAPLSGLRVSGILALAIGTMIFYRSLYNIDDPIAGRAQFLLALCLTVACYIGSERIIAWGRTGPFGAAWEAGIVRSALVAVAILLAGLGLWEWAAQERLTLYCLGMAVAAMALGVLFRESRYRWAALAVYFGAIIRAYVYDLTTLSPILQFLSFGALCIPLLVMSWAYSHYRVRQLGELDAESGSPSDG